MSLDDVTLRMATSEDAAAICAIYNYYISNTIITFEELELASEDIARRISGVEKAGLPWLVAEMRGALLGYAYAAPWKDRSAYRHTVEVSIYLKHGVRIKGLGSLLYGQLFGRLRESPVHVALAGIALPNPASIALHEKFGMRKTAHLQEVGFKFHQWIDVAYWQVTLD